MKTIGKTGSVERVVLAVRGLLVPGLGLAFALASGCSFSVDTTYLTAGDEGLDCSGSEKRCPVDPEDPDGQKACVKADPEVGCGSERCSPCEVPGAVARCLKGGECGVSICEGLNADCDLDGDSPETNGCETDTSQDNNNCGACERKCERTNAVANCVKGICEFVVCLPGFDNCDGKTSNGCEVDVDTSNQHCGECNTPCAGTCVNGECQL